MCSVQARFIKADYLCVFMNTNTLYCTNMIHLQEISLSFGLYMIQKILCCSLCSDQHVCINPAPQPEWRTHPERDPGLVYSDVSFLSSTEFCKVCLLPLLCPQTWHKKKEVVDCSSDSKQTIILLLFIPNSYIRKSLYKHSLRYPQARHSNPKCWCSLARRKDCAGTFWMRMSLSVKQGSALNLLWCLANWVWESWKSKKCQQSHQHMTYNSFCPGIISNPSLSADK